MTALNTYHIRDILVKRKEHGAPLKVLNLRTCFGPKRAIQLLSETVGNVQRPARTLKAGLAPCYDLERTVDEEERTDDNEYDDGPGPWDGPRRFDEDEDDDDEDDFDSDFDN